MRRGPRNQAGREPASPAGTQQASGGLGRESFAPTRQAYPFPGDGPRSWGEEGGTGKRAPGGPRAEGGAFSSSGCADPRLGRPTRAAPPQRAPRAREACPGCWRIKGPRRAEQAANKCALKSEPGRGTGRTTLRNKRTRVSSDLLTPRCSARVSSRGSPCPGLGSSSVSEQSQSSGGWGRGPRLGGLQSPTECLGRAGANFGSPHWGDPGVALGRDPV